jgi:hypothetical protein
MAGDGNDAAEPEAPAPPAAEPAAKSAKPDDAESPVEEAIAAVEPEPPAPSPRAASIAEKKRQIAKFAGHWARVRWVQLVIAVALAFGHLGAFARAGHSRLNIPFDLAPGAHLQFTDLRAGALSGFPRQPPKWSRLVVSRMDAQHYIGTALRGLYACPKDPKKANGNAYLACGLGWLPGYGVVGTAAMKLTGLEPDFALVLVSTVCAIILNLLWICPMMVRRMGLLGAYGVLLAWNCYPGAMYLVTPLVEAMVMALTIGGFVMLSKQRWVASAFLIGASTALRLPTVDAGFALGCCLLFATWQQYKAHKPQWWRPLIAIPLCGWGQFLTMLVFQIKLGNWHAYFDARWNFGDKNRVHRFFELTYFLQGFKAQNADMIMYIALVAITLLTWRRALAGFTSIERMFIIISSVITFILAIAAPIEYWGITRYMMLGMLPFLGMGVLAKRHRGLFVMWLVLSLGIYWNFELCNYVTQGDPAACPCAGRNEMHLPWAS